MYFLTLIIALNMALPALGCPPPFNNWDFAGHSTHNTAELVEAALLNEPALCWIDAVTSWGNPSKPWPRRDTSPFVASVSFCYENKRAYDNLSNLLIKALKLWIEKIGERGQESGHALEMMDLFFNIPEPYCYYQASHPKAGQWNDALFKPGSVVVVQKEKDPIGARLRELLRVIGQRELPTGTVFRLIEPSS
jgi:hypothetical protein